MKNSMMMKTSILIVWLLFAYSAAGQELLIYLDVNSPNTDGILSYSVENISLSVQSTEAKDKLTRPWFQALPILGDYKIVEIADLPELGPVIRLQAQTGKGKMLQRFGKGGLLLLTDLNASGLWRSKANTPLQSFGVLSVIDKEALSQLAAKVTVEMPVVIKSLAEKKQVRWFRQETVDYWLFPNKFLVPVPKRFVSTENLQKAIVLDSETAQVLTLEIQKSFVTFQKPDTLQNVPFPRIRQANIAIWRVPKADPVEFVSRSETNTNTPFIFQQTIPKMLKRGDKLVILCTERLDRQLETTLDIPKLLSKAQTALPDTFTLLKLKDWLSQQIADPLITQLLITELTEQALRPVKIINDQIKWTWHLDLNPIKLENFHYPLLRVFVYSL